MSDTVTVTPASERTRFEIHQGQDLAGFAEYRDHGRQRIFHHTEIGEQYGGKGLGSKLIRGALTDTVAAGMRIVPVCSFVAKFLDTHDDFAGSVDEVTPEIRTLLD